MAVSITLEPEIDLSTPIELFDGLKQPETLRRTGCVAYLQRIPIGIRTKRIQYARNFVEYARSVDLRRVFD